MAYRNREKERSEGTRQKNNLIFFDAELRFALFASLRSAIFGLILFDN